MFLSMHRKEELEYEEDKEEVDYEIARMKSLIFKLNSSEQGWLKIDTFEKVIEVADLWKKSQIGEEEKRYMHLLFE